MFSGSDPLGIHNALNVCEVLASPKKGPRAQGAAASDTGSGSTGRHLSGNLNLVISKHHLLWTT